MQVFKKSFLVLFVLILSLAFVHCTGSSKKVGNNTGDGSEDIVYIDNTALENTHAYSVIFERGDEVFSFLGDAKMGDKVASVYIKDGKGFVSGEKNYKVITLYIDHKELIKIDAVFILDENGKPFPLKQSKLSNGPASSLRITDIKSGNVYTALSGKVVINNLKTVADSTLHSDIATYSLEYDAKFNLVVPKTGENIIYPGTGKLEIAPFKKQD